MSLTGTLIVAIVGGSVDSGLAIAGGLVAQTREHNSSTISGPVRRAWRTPGIGSERAPESRIPDADIASEMVTFTKLPILQHARTSMLARGQPAP